MIDERDDGDAGEVSDLEDAYTLLGELGRGGSAIVYRARDRSLHREVAIKVVRPRFAASAEEAVTRLAREARTVARLQHPNIVTVHAVHRLRDGGLALVMQLVPGRTLKQAIADEGPLAPERAESILREVAQALAFAHAHGVVHRDVKPENIFLEAGSGRALLADFGIAHSTEFDSRLTMDGAAIGTPAYMAPEQIDGAPANVRSDLYSLGLVGWEMLTGERPWEGEALYNVIFKQKNDDLPAIDALRPGAVPARLQYIIERLMQKRPSARWPGAEGLLSALNNWVAPSDWGQWEESHRRRRDAVKAKPKGKSQHVEALATVRFARPEPGSMIPNDSDAVTTAVASSAATIVVAEDDAPSWATVAPVQRGRRFSLFVGLALLLGGGSVVTYVQRQGLFHAPVAPTSSLTDSRVVALPIVAEHTADSTADSTSDSTADSRTTVTSTGSLGDPAMVDSARAAAAARRAARRVAKLAPANGDSASGHLAPPSAPTAVPTVVPEPPRAEAVRATDDPGIIAAGGRHSCALIGGKVQCWGANDKGQLGDGDVESRDVPAAVVGDLSFVQVATGREHSCGIVRGGEAYCWGADERGQLGDATTTSRSAPVRVAGNHSFRVVRTGVAHTCGLTTAGQVACWGSNADGQIGDGGAATRSSPAMIDVDVRFVALTAGWNHSCAIASDGTAYCWGANAAGQLGNGARADSRVPVAVSGGLKFTSLSAGGTHTCGVTDASEVYCWGKNGYGQLGTGSTTDQTVPMRAETATRFASVTAGGVHTCARTRGGQAWCWGRNVYGQVGDGSNANRDVPTRVVGGAAFAALNATTAHTCGATTDGETLCWGFNVEGQLGDGTRNHNARPTRVTLVAR